jgi:hypothetical protein
MSFIVKRGSWHYRLFLRSRCLFIDGTTKYGRLDADRMTPRSLCPYFWKAIVFPILLAPFWLLADLSNKAFSVDMDDAEHNIVIRSIFGLWLLFLTAAFPAMLGHSIQPEDAALTPWHWLYGVALIGAALAAVFGLGWTFFRSIDLYSEWRSRRSAAGGSTSVIRSYMKARREKVCPMVEVVD